ncbi:MAG: L,D-transpeptidase family protein [Chitinophagaceae bacterium]|nr:L,D-transpeptidase family protein [Chitinophagaceae bacterium]
MYRLRSFIKTTSLFPGIILCLLCGCKQKSSGQTIAETPRELQEKVTGLLQEMGPSLTDGRISGDTSTLLRQGNVTKLIYESRQYQPLWSAEEKWLPVGDSLLNIIDAAKLYGLFPEDYYANQLKTIRDKFNADSMAKGDRKDALLWTKAELLLTDGLIQLMKDIKLGRLPNDSITLRKDSTLSNEFIQQKITELLSSGSVTATLATLEPRHRGYHLLKQGIPAFLRKADYRQYTIVPSSKTPGFTTALQKRLFEAGYLPTDSVRADSVQLAAAIKKFQKDKNITVDGKAGEGTIRMLNTNDKEKFIRIAISMDRYKMLPEKMPDRYIWVNASSNYLEVIDKDVVKFSSKVICGKAKTRTPVLSSQISSLITYPQWVPPPSIVSKEILPAVKKNPGYLAKKGFTLVNSEGEEVDPYSVDWSRYSKGIPYRIVQGSGDANALGVMKFVFDNKYSVYLHDTNQRYLFGNAMRSLSHGCVRVQDWEKLAVYIIKNDSIQTKGRNYTPVDSMKTWLRNKQKKNIALRNKMPVFIRYITCEGKDGNILFYDDVYAEDKLLREKYFATR